MEKSRYPNKLKKYRRLFGFSQKQVAVILGLLDSSPLSRWEKGWALPSILFLFRLSRIYKTMPSELYLDLWHSVSEEMVTAEQNLLTPVESIINNDRASMNY